MGDNSLERWGPGLKNLSKLMTENQAKGPLKYSPPSGHTKHLSDSERAHDGTPGAKVDHGHDTMKSHERIAKLKTTIGKGTPMSEHGDTGYQDGSPFGRS